MGRVRNSNQQIVKEQPCQNGVQSSEQKRTLRQAARNAKTTEPTDTDKEIFNGIKQGNMDRRSQRSGKVKKESPTASRASELSMSCGTPESKAGGKRKSRYSAETQPSKKKGRSDDTAKQSTKFSCSKDQSTKCFSNKQITKSSTSKVGISGSSTTEVDLSSSFRSEVKPDKKESVHGAFSSESNAVDKDTAAGKLVGAHCSIAGGLHNAVEEAVSMGGRAFGLFLRSQRTWNSKPLDPEAAEKFKESCKEHGFPPNSILPHGSYLMNCGSPSEETLRKSRGALLEELQRCEALGLTLYNFHPGSTCGEMAVDECLDKIAESINWAHSQTKFVTTVIENMSCQGNTVGGRFEELKGIIDRVKDKSRIGVCLDTCHAFAAGFDLSSKEGFDKFLYDFDSIVGFEYLRAIHLNDSKGGVGCHLDRHENIGKGQIGLEGFRRVMAEPRFGGIPMILETPVGDYAKEIKTLNKLACS